MGLTPGPGHNRGPSMEGGVSWRRHVWTKAREDLLPTLPIEVVRTRVKRAAELGLPYKTYASFRAQTGNDLIGFLFSSNALDLLRSAELAEEKAAKLATLKQVTRAAIVHAPLSPEAVAALDPIDSAHAAPRFSDSWPTMRDRMRAILRATGGPADRYMLVGETAFEKDWGEAARVGGYLTGTRYFGGAA